MKRLAIIIFFATFSSLAISQNENDALRYSQTTFGGTARSTAMGGAFGALGADFSSLYINPAGIALYKKSEFTITPSIYSSKIESKYNGNTSSDIKFNFNLSNLGIVFGYNLPNRFEDKKWVNVNFGVGIDRIANFNNQYSIEGVNSTNSLLYDYAKKAYGKTPDNLDPFDTKLAYDANLLYNPDSNNLSYYNYDAIFGGVMQKKSIETKGGMDELVFATGANYADKVYLGATLSIPFVNYVEQSEYSEIDHKDTIPYFNSLKLNEDIETYGTGFNMKFGIILRPIDMIRLGASIQTPTVISLTDKYSRKLVSDLTYYGMRTANSPKGEFDYDITTPMRATLSGALIISKFGLVSVDYEFIDYTEARLRSADDKFFDQNSSIQNNFASQQNIRVGGELKLNPFVLRGGYALYGNPYKSSINNAEKVSYTGGFGIRDNDYFVDFAVVYTEGKEKYYLYPSVPTPVQINTFSKTFLVTLGFKF